MIMNNDGHLHGRVNGYVNVCWAQAANCPAIQVVGIEVRVTKDGDAYSTEIVLTEEAAEKLYNTLRRVYSNDPF